MAIKLHLSINDITNALRLLFFIGPPIAFWITKRICLSLQRARPPEGAARPRDRHHLAHADGRFEEIHEPLTPVERWPLVQHEVPEPLELGPGGRRQRCRQPRRPEGADLRAKLSRFYFSDRVAPATPSELEAAHHEHDVQETQPVSVAPEEIEPAARH